MKQLIKRKTAKRRRDERRALERKKAELGREIDVLSNRYNRISTRLELLRDLEEEEREARRLARSA